MTTLATWRTAASLETRSAKGLETRVIPDFTTAYLSTRDAEWAEIQAELAAVDQAAATRAQAEQTVQYRARQSARESDLLDALLAADDARIADEDALINALIEQPLTTVPRLAAPKSPLRLHAGVSHQAIAAAPVRAALPSAHTYRTLPRSAAIASVESILTEESVAEPRPTRELRTPTAFRTIYGKPATNQKRFPALREKFIRYAASAALLLTPIAAGNGAGVNAVTRIPIKSPTELATEYVNAGIFNTWPVLNEEIRLNSMYGKRSLPESTIGSRYHKGNDVRARGGKTVVAMHEGEVAAIEADVVTIRADKFTYLYRHILPKKGLHVGQHLAEREAVGRARTHLEDGMVPHLHYEVTADSTALNGVCLFSAPIREAVITEMESRGLRRFLPTGLRHWSGRNIAEKFENSCAATRAKLIELYTRDEAIPTVVRYDPSN